MITSESGSPRHEGEGEGPAAFPDGSWNYWLSWYHGPRMGVLRAGFPWWETGKRIRMAMGQVDLKGDSVMAQVEDLTLCAALRARDDDDAKAIVRLAYETYPSIMEWRFVERRPMDWSPFGGRFARADWMVWPPETLIPEEKAT